nr:unnamed protein product [Spirometra erinaceieuropaei]
MQLRSHQKKQINQRGLMTEKRETEIGRLRSTRRKELPGVEKQSSSEQSTGTSSASVDTDAANANILCIDIKDMSSIAPNTKPLAAEKIPGVDGNQNVIMNGSPGTPKSPTSRNQDRPLREQCLVIQGLQEPQADTPKERVLADLGLFQGLLNTLLQPDEEISVLKAFRLGKRSTEPAIPPHPRPLKIVLSCKEHQWTRAIDEGNVVHVAYIDFKKAFDSVPHQRLLYKLSRIGVRGKLLKWIEDFLVGRSQTVRLGGQHSAEVTVTSGVSQGSLLGPILFLIYIDDCIHGLDCRIAMFADDIKLWTVIHNEDDEANLQAN